MVCHGVGDFLLCSHMENSHILGGEDMQSLMGYCRQVKLSLRWWW